MAPNAQDVQTPSLVKSAHQSPSLEAVAPQRVVKDEATLLKTAPSAKSLDPDLESAIEQEEEEELNVTKELAALLTLAYPMMVTYVFEFLPELVCISIVGHIDSSETPKYVDGAMLSIMWMEVSALAVGFGLSSALDTLCSQAYGAEQYHKIGIYLQCGFIVVGAASIPVFLLNWFSEFVLASMGIDADVARYAGEFSRYTAFGLPALFGYEMVRKVLHAQNVTRPFVIIAVIENIVNLVGGFYLTYHTSMGFHGAALARMLVNLMLPVLCVPYFLWNREYHRRWWPGWQLRKAWRQVRVFLKLGIPALFMLAMEYWAFEVMALMAGLLPNGVVAVSAHAVLMNMSSLFYMVFTGLSTAGNVRVGNALGANEQKRARLISRITITTGLAVSVVLTALVITFRFEIPGLFINDPVSIELAAQSVLGFACYELVDGVNCALQAICRGAGWQDLAAKANAIALYVVGLPLAGLAGFVMLYGVPGLWIGFALGVLSSCVVCAVVLYRANWQQMADDASQRMSLLL